MQKTDIYLKGKIYQGCEKPVPRLDLVGHGAGYNTAGEEWIKHLLTLTSYECPSPHPFTEGQNVTGLYEVRYQCPSCGGDGKETCSNPDHGFINAMGGEIGRLGCPVCGHDKNYKVNRGRNTCPECNGKGYLLPDMFEQCAIEIGFDDSPTIYAIALPTSVVQPETPVVKQEAWEWTDALVLEFSVRSHLPGREITIEQFKQLKSNTKD